MSSLFYSLGVRAYFSLLRLISPWHLKAKKMIQGRRRSLSDLEKTRKKGVPTIWMHVSSLGEYEQGYPLLERIRKDLPNAEVVLTFFSPSGYDVRHNTPLADIVTYLPADTSGDLKRFIEILNPTIALFVKYEFWLNTISILHQKRVPVFLISAIFRPNQIFFKSWGKEFKEALRKYEHLFVQDENSLQLLTGIGLNADKITIAGDTRADRVCQIALHPKEIKEAEYLREDATQKGQLILVVGSSWEEDENIILPYLLTLDSIRIIIAPHEIHSKHQNHLEEIIGKENLVCLSHKPSEAEISSVKVLIIDSYGLLSSLYRYADITYVGGGFGKGIHNTLEAIAFGAPVVFGPKYQKFREAVSLLSEGGGFSISSKEEADSLMSKLISDKDFRQTAGSRAEKYLSRSKGATDTIFEKISDTLENRLRN
ncbi:MAG: glycosyltransferase N-terminal domain-containing protein [Porphyromonas sp.]|nr:glycosyltransferase N-terminal domain-containing protein [Porphyromonas sp.]